MALPFGVNLAGFLTAESGLGESARQVGESLKAAGVPVALNIVINRELINAEKPPDGLRADNPYFFNLTWVNASAADAYVHDRGAAYFAGHYNIGYCVWEMADLPEEWLPRLSLFDEIWVPTRFVQDAVARRSPVPVYRFPHAIAPRRQVVQTCGALRGLANLPDDSFVFLFAFHFHGNVERKNPFAVIAAFQQALADRKDAFLVIKCAAGEGTPELARMIEATRGTNIRIINETLSRQGVDRLVEDCDCYVSLHRSEGYGLSLAEAMTFGKPVIATGYSGNLDFMTPDNSYLVPYRLVEVEAKTGPYLQGWQWAEPDVSAAAELMRHVYANRAEAREKGLRARSDIVQQLHPDTIGASIRAHLETISRE